MMSLSLLLVVLNGYFFWVAIQKKTEQWLRRWTCGMLVTAVLAMVVWFPLYLKALGMQGRSFDQGFDYLVMSGNDFRPWPWLIGSMGALVISVSCGGACILCVLALRKRRSADGA